MTEAMVEANNSEAISEHASTGGKETVALKEDTISVQKDEEQQQTKKMSAENLIEKETSTAHPVCLTIQPNRVLCGVRRHKKGLNAG